MVAVLGIGGLLWAFEWFRPGLDAQEGCKEGGGITGFAQCQSKAPGGPSGVPVVMEVKMTHRGAREAGEGVDGARGQGGDAAALTSATGVSGKAPQEG